MGRRRTRIDPDEVLIDATNLPHFDESQFEGRIEQPLSRRSLVSFAVCALVVVVIFTGRSFFLQIIEGEAYARESEHNRLEHSVLFSDRGLVYDRNGTELAWNTVHEEKPFAKRVYLSEAGVAHLVGYVGYPLADEKGIFYQETFVGKSGIEHAFDAALAGHNGLKIVERNALDDIQSESLVRPPESGSDIVLSVDAEVSRELYRLLKERAEESGFTGGGGVIMDIESGEILALANYPEYEQNALLGGGGTINELLSDGRKPFLNRVTAGLYAPGSIVKPFIALAALEEGVIDPGTKLLSTGSISIPNPYFPDQPSVFRDWRAHGWVDMRSALAVSSDVYFYEIGGGFKEQEGLGIDRIERYMRQFGFGELTGIDFATEGQGTIPNPEWKAATFPEDGTWRLGNTYHTAIGQYGFQVTPLQAVRAVAALANGGVLVTPTVQKGVLGERAALHFAKSNLAIVREGMRMAVTNSNGTAQGLSVPWVSVAAKTGTAELGAEKEFVNSWVVGFFPYEQPRFAFAVLLERGPAENTIGGLYVMRQLLEWMNVHAPQYFEN
jgi:penicillin-binding protein 2